MFVVVFVSSTPALMSVPPRSRKASVAAMLTDPHLWLPVIVLVLGVGVLAWVHG